MKLPIRIVVDEAPTREDRKVLERAIDDFNASAVPGELERFGFEDRCASLTNW